MKLSGSQAVLKSLIEEGTEYIFGYPGGAIMPVYDAMMEYHEDIKHILTRHEQGAIHAAQGYARVSGKVGVCMVTSGPAATNTVTGLATAYMDSAPMICITGQVATTAIGSDAFQEADVMGITRPVTKHNYLIRDAKDITRVVREAFYLATSGRPGPILIDFPVDVSRQEVEFEWPEETSIRG